MQGPATTCPSNAAVELGNSVEAMRNLKEGDICDVLDEREEWCTGCVIKVNTNGLKVHYIDWGDEWDRLFKWSLWRLNPNRTPTPARPLPLTPTLTEGSFKLLERMSRGL